MIKFIAFDLDGTLADSKSEINEKISSGLRDLLGRYEICIITGGALDQISKQVIDKLPLNSNLENLHLMPTCGTRYLRYTNLSWNTIYENNIPEETRLEVIRDLESVSKSLGLWEDNSHGPIIEDRLSQITYSALGQNAPLGLKEMWDIKGVKKELLRTAMEELYPELGIRIGGNTSIDITMKNMDKAFGIEQLLRANGIDKNELLFIGDRLELGGNDYPVISTGVSTFQVKNWNDTLSKIQTLLN